MLIFWTFFGFTIGLHRSSSWINKTNKTISENVTRSVISFTLSTSIVNLTGYLDVQNDLRLKVILEFPSIRIYRPFIHKSNIKCSWRGEGSFWTSDRKFYSRQFKVHILTTMTKIDILLYLRLITRTLYSPDESH